MKRAIVLLLTLALLVLSHAQVALASQNSYTPTKLNYKDEQNIDFLYKNFKGNLNYSDVVPGSEELPKALQESLVSRKKFSEYYYSPDEEAFKIRESMKLLRAMTCKASRISGVRGLDIVSKVMQITEESNTNAQPLDLTTFWKDAYESFCPDLW